MKLRHLPLVIVGLIFVLSGCVEQQEYQALRSMVYENRTSINSISQQVAQVDQKAAQANQQVAQAQQDVVQATQKARQAQQKAALARQPHASLQAEVASLRQDLAMVRGSVEEMNHRFQKIPNQDDINKAVQTKAGGFKTQMDKLKADLNKSRAENKALKGQIGTLNRRMAALESYLSLNEPRPKKSGSPKKKTSKPRKAAPPKTAKASYELARNLYKKKSYQAARDRFEGVISRYPNSIYVPSAHFWVGESYYAQKKYEEAVLSYNSVIKHYPKSPKVPSALLKQGLAFRALGDIRTAKIVLNKLVKGYRKSQQASTAKKVLKQMK